MSNLDHWFWWLLAMACVVWYSSITVYIAFRGARDIRNMLKRLASRDEVPIHRVKPPATKVNDCET